ncbi:leader peptidase (prepilin peptidase)/N-methyltransferase [Nitrospirillum amazonense]|uniref:Prepilin leader peptidase/N-methyltransferase n=1 Tax=Nitrospirillum amazonense TaxID=28077 RepID=A0A560JU37_9PROT|nr:leader peptidase (prepilin peptidase)/N-methyltransferase [Nitrospirillum amazonense]
MAGGPMESRDALGNGKVDIITLWTLLIAAPFVGSFLGVVVTRLPEGRSVVWGRSACDRCGHTLGPASLVPVLSYLWSRGRCRHCAAPIDAFHPAIELAAVLPPLCLAFLMPLDSLTLCAGAGLGWVLLALAWIDLRHMILPDVLTLPLAAAGILVAWVQDGRLPIDRLAAAAAAYAGLVLLEVLYRRFRGRDGIGRGDAKLLAAGGAWVGPAALPQVLLTAALAGLLAMAALRLAGRRVDAATPIPFGPCLALGIWAAWLFTLSGL